MNETMTEAPEMPQIRHTKTRYQISLEERRKLAWTWYRRGYSQREIAEALGISAPTVCLDIQRVARERKFSRPPLPKKNT